METLRRHVTELIATNTRLIAAQAQATRELRAADQRFEEERDRRYTEVKNAEEKALRIKSLLAKGFMRAPVTVVPNVAGPIEAWAAAGPGSSERAAGS